MRTRMFLLTLCFCLCFTSQVKSQQIQMNLGNGVTMTQTVQHTRIDLTPYKNALIAERIRTVNEIDKNIADNIVAALKQTPPDIDSLLYVAGCSKEKIICAASRADTKDKPLEAQAMNFGHHMSFIINILGEIKAKYPECPKIDKAVPVLTEIVTHNMGCVQISRVMCDPYDLRFVDVNDFGEAQRVQAAEALVKFGVDAKGAIPAIEKILESPATIKYSNSKVTKNLADMSYKSKKLTAVFRETIDKIKQSKPRKP